MRLGLILASLDYVQFVVLGAALPRRAPLLCGVSVSTEAVVSNLADCFAGGSML